MMRVGFIGLGSQGGPMARRIVEAGHPLTIWARRPETLAPFADTAATVAASPSEVAATSDLVCLCVGNDADVANMLNNLVFTAQLTVAIETYDFAAALGIDRAAMAEVLASGSGGSRAAGVIAGSNFDTSGLRQAAAGLLAKDVGIMSDVAERAGATPPPHVSALAQSTLETLTPQLFAAESSASTMRPRVNGAGATRAPTRAH